MIRMILTEYLIWSLVGRSIELFEKLKEFVKVLY